MCVVLTELFDFVLAFDDSVEVADGNNDYLFLIWQTVELLVSLQLVIG